MAQTREGPQTQHGGGKPPHTPSGGPARDTKWGRVNRKSTHRGFGGATHRFHRGEPMCQVTGPPIASLRCCLRPGAPATSRNRDKSRRTWRFLDVAGALRPRQHRFRGTCGDACMHESGGRGAQSFHTNARSICFRHLTTCIHLRMHVQ